MGCSRSYSSHSINSCAVDSNKLVAVQFDLSDEIRYQVSFAFFVISLVS